MHDQCSKLGNLILNPTVEPRFNEVPGDWPNLFVKWRVRYVENNLDITNLRGKDQNVCYIKVIVQCFSQKILLEGQSGP